MNILHLQSNEESISYHKHVAVKNKAPCIIFHHGFMSDMNSHKALYIEKYCQEMDYSFIRFDNFGCGGSSGSFVDQTMSTWLKGGQYVMDELTEGPIILVGSSLGGWIATLSSIQNKKVVGVVAIAAAYDFTEELIWNSLSPEQKEALQKQKVFEVKSGKTDCSNIYPININLINDARQYLLLDKEKIAISCPIHLIHGMQDIDVPHSLSERAVAKISSNNVILKLIKDGDHRMSRPADLRIICNSIDEIIALYNT